MQYWRGLLYLAWLALLPVHSKAATQIQGQPVGVIYNQSSGSYDSFNKAAQFAPLNGLNQQNISHLNASFARSKYVDRANAFGVLAFDQMGLPLSGYLNANLLNLLNNGSGWNGAYVDKVPAFPAMAWDAMTNYTQALTVFDSIGTVNGGNDNGSSVSWTSGYIAHNQGGVACAVPAGLDAVTLTTPGTITNTQTSCQTDTSGYYGYQFVANHDMIVTALGAYDSGPAQVNGGSGPFNSTIVQLAGASVQITMGTNQGAFTYVCLNTPILLKAGSIYQETILAANWAGTGKSELPGFRDSNTVVTSSATIGVMGPFVYGVGCVANGGNTYVAQTNTMYGPLTFRFDMGYLFSTNVVANGGAKPADATVNALDTFYAGLVTDGIEGKMRVVNAMTPDNLTAARTPLIYYAGSQPWANTAFVGADIGVNGLTGDGSSKFLNTGYNPNTDLGATFGGSSIYGYTVTGTGGATALVVDATPHRFGIFGKFTDTHAYGENATSLADGGVSPGNGYYSDERTGSTAHNLYFANSGSGWASIASEVTAFTSYPALNVFVQANNNNGGATLFSVGPISFVSFHKGLTTGQGQSLYNRVQTLRTTLGGGFR